MPPNCSGVASSRRPQLVEDALSKLLGNNMLFIDRHDAGKQLAERLLALKDENPVVLALPRGGVSVGFEVVRVLAAPLDLVTEVQPLSIPQDILARCPDQR